MLVSEPQAALTYKQWLGNGLRGCRRAQCEKFLKGPVLQMGVEKISGTVNILASDSYV